VPLTERDTDTILRVCEASAIFSSELERRAVEAQNSEERVAGAIAPLCLFNDCRKRAKPGDRKRPARYAKYRFSPTEGIETQNGAILCHPSHHR